MPNKKICMALSTAFRTLLRFNPNKSITADSTLTHEENDDTDISFKNGLFAPTCGDTSPFSFVELSSGPLSTEVLGADKLGVEWETDDVNLTVNWEVPNNLMLTSTTGARSFYPLEVFDADGTQTWFLKFSEDTKDNQFSQKISLLHTSDKLNTTAGISYFIEEVNQAIPFSTEESIYLNCLGALGS